MESEIEFLQRRLEILKETIEQPSKFEIDEKGGFHMLLDTSPHIEHAFIREAHLIQKLLSQAKEGQVTHALSKWRKLLGEKLHAHREFYRPMQEAYDHWLSFPLPTRIEIPEPPHPPELEITDVQGSAWIVDEKLFTVIHDLQTRLEKWMSSD
jgi:hypothetical protein